MLGGTVLKVGAMIIVIILLGMTLDSLIYPMDNRLLFSVTILLCILIGLMLWKRKNKRFAIILLSSFGLWFSILWIRNFLFNYL